MTINCPTVVKKSGKGDAAVVSGPLKYAYIGQMPYNVMGCTTKRLNTPLRMVVLFNAAEGI